MPVQPDQQQLAVGAPQSRPRLSDVHQLFALTCIFEFDASVVDGDLGWLIYISHDGVVYMARPKGALGGDAADKYKPYWDVREGAPPRHFP